MCAVLSLNRFLYLFFVSFGGYFGIFYSLFMYRLIVIITGLLSSAETPSLKRLDNPNSCQAIGHPLIEPPPSSTTKPSMKYAAHKKQFS